MESNPVFEGNFFLAISYNNLCVTEMLNCVSPFYLYVAHLSINKTLMFNFLNLRETSVLQYTERVTILTVESEKPSQVSYNAMCLHLMMIMAIVVTLIRSQLLI